MSINNQIAQPMTHLTTRLIPCLDIRDGRVVKGVKFQGLRDAGDPVDCAQRYEADGADELVILDERRETLRAPRVQAPEVLTERAATTRVRTEGDPGIDPGDRQAVEAPAGRHLTEHLGGHEPEAADGARDGHPQGAGHDPGHPGLATLQDDESDVHEPEY